MTNFPQRVGFYCWAGPGTVRMINLKFFNPRIDHLSLMGSYEYDYLARIQETFGVTDFWATYSWGFAPETEAEDRAFLISRLGNFKQLGIRVHAYIQGPNVVYKDFANRDWYALDEKGRFITYHRGRRVTCINNPEFREFQLEKISGMIGVGFDGVYVDNIQMGQLGLGGSEMNPIIFAGCSCAYCAKLFKETSGENIPIEPTNAEVLQKYMQFRVDSTTRFVTDMATIAHEGTMVFGTNSFDPGYDTKTIFGTDLKKLAQVQDYLLFENHAAPGAAGPRGNEHVRSWIQHKPVYVVSYNKGIGKEREFSQIDFDRMFSEAQAGGFSPCIKGSEYVTKGVWHNLAPERYTQPRTDLVLPAASTHKRSNVHSIANVGLSRLLLRRYYNPLFRTYMENRGARIMLDPIYFRAIR